MNVAILGVLLYATIFDGVMSIGDGGVVEFGRRHVNRKSVRRAKKKKKGGRLSIAELSKVDELLIEEDLHWIAYDMSLSMKTPTVPPATSPSDQPAVITTPSPSPTTTPTTPTTVSPSDDPSSLPSDFPSFTPSTPPTPTANFEKVVFECTEEGVTIAQPPYGAVDLVVFNVAYLVETSALVFQYLEDLESSILHSALRGALNCSAVGSTTTQVSMFTAIAGQVCLPEQIDNNCIVYETAFQVALVSDSDPATAARQGYVVLRDDMDGGLFVEDIPLLDRVEYLGPDLDGQGAIISDESLPSDKSEVVGGEAVSTRPSIIGGIGATLIGFIFAAFYWNRRQRQASEN